MGRGEPAGSEIARTLRGMALLGLAILLLWRGAAVFLLVFAGLLLAIFLATAARWVGERLRLPYAWALPAVILALAVCLGGVGWLVLPRIAVQADQLAQALPTAIDDFRRQVGQYAWGQAVLDRLRADQLLPSRSDILAQVTGVASTTLGMVANLFVVLFVGLYGAAEPGTYRGGLIRLVPLRRRARAGEILDEVHRALSWWLLGRLCSMVVVGVATGLGLWLLGVPLALTLGLIAAALGFIPYIGPILAAVPAVLIGLTQGPQQALYVLLFYLGLQTLESYLLTPLVQRQAVSLPPVLQLAVQVLAGVLFGVLGLALATPLAAAGLVVTRMVYVEDVLGDRPHRAKEGSPAEARPSAAPDR